MTLGEPGEELDMAFGLLGLGRGAIVALTGAPMAKGLLLVWLCVDKMCCCCCCCQQMQLFEDQDAHSRNSRAFVGVKTSCRQRSSVTSMTAII